MTNAEPRAGSSPEPDVPVEFEHPRGTLAIVIVFGALFALGWFAMFFYRFLGSDVPHH